MRQRFLIFTNDRDARRFFLRRNLSRLLVVALVLLACALVGVFVPRCANPSVPPPATDTPTPTVTQTISPTETSTWTPVPTVVTPSLTPTFTPSFTTTPTETLSPATETATPSPSTTPTDAPTFTPTPTPTPGLLFPPGRPGTIPTTGAASRDDFYYLLACAGLALLAVGIEFLKLGNESSDSENPR